MLLLDAANELAYYRLGFTIKSFVKIALTLVAIIVLIKCVIDLFKLVMKPEETRTTLKQIASRFVSGLIVFLLPVIIDYGFHELTEYKDDMIVKYYEGASLEKIKEYEKKAEEEAKAAKEQRAKEATEAARKQAEEKERQNAENSQYMKIYEERKKARAKANGGSIRRNGTPIDVPPGYTKYVDDGMSYYVYIPENATTNMPLLIWMHGDGPSESYLVNNKIGPTAAQAGYPAIIVEPFAGSSLGSKSNPGWYEGGLLPHVKKIADKVCEQYQCDTNMISVGGHSRGAIGTWMMVSAYPGYFYAAAPVSCCSFYGMKAASFQDMKVWAWRGTGAGDGSNNDDTYGHCMQSDVNAVSKYASEVKYTIQPGTTHGQATNKLQVDPEFSKFMFG